MVYHGANDIRFEEKPRPQIIDPTDAVVKIVKTTICGTDLGIWKGKNPEVTPYADNSLVPLPDNVNEEVALLLSDALPTAQCNMAM